jgi:hypothetical protein
VSHWAAEEFRALPLEEIDVRYGRYRLSVLEAAFVRLAGEAQVVAELTEDFVKEIHLP